MATLSVVIIVKNESANIEACLGSVSFADEVVVVDAGSTDRTVELARSMGASVYVTPDWPGFGKQKNRALTSARSDWVLSVDADERVTPDLQREIMEMIRSPASFDGFRLPRLSSYCGQFILHSGWSPDYVLRLFKRNRAKFSDDLVHEKVICDGAVGTLLNPLIHLSFPDFESVLDKVNRYSTAGAQSMSDRDTASSLSAALGHGLWAFFRTYVLRRGFLDGQLGLALAISNAEGTYYRYAKHWLMTLHAKKVSDDD